MPPPPPPQAAVQPAAPAVVLLFGDRGWIGGQLRELLVARGMRVVGAGDTRADDAAAVRTLLVNVAPDRVVCTIGRTRGPGAPTIDFLEDAPKEHGKLALNLRDNLFAPVTLALACAERGVHFTYLGTGCIFDVPDPAAPDAPAFDEATDPNFFGSAYSVVKGFTDRLMRQLPGAVLQARVRMPIAGDDSPHDFVSKIARYARVCSVANSMSVLPTLLPCLCDLVLRGTTGTLNLTNPGVITHDRVLELYRDLVDPAFAWRNFTRAEQDAVLAARRSNNRLDTTLLRRLCPTVPDVEDAVRTALARLGARRRLAASSLDERKDNPATAKIQGPFE